jgi:hypothetical protein
MTSHHKKTGHTLIKPFTNKKQTPEEKDQNQNRFEAARGTATIKWHTDELMKMLRGD